MSFRILCTGDIHLGRRPVHLPAGLDAASLGPAAVWRTLVELAIERRVDAVALTGDVVDQDHRYYEAFSALQAGVGRLVQASIDVLAVSGNHDFDVLPRLAEQFEGVHLLGRGGRWEHTVLSRNGQSVCVQGWSFPAAHVPFSPMDGYVPPPAGMQTVGLLHCDCGAPASQYAPVAPRDLTGRPPAAWLLGHIHQSRRIHESGPLILYPGSPVGLDASETGPHGAWLITLEPGRDVAAEPLHLGPLRWETIELSLADLADEAALGPAVTRAVKARHDQIRDQLAWTRAVACRLRLVGRTAIHRRLPALLDAVQRDLRTDFDDVSYFIEKIQDDSQPDLPLEAIARSSDPAGLLAGRLLTLERRQPTDDYERLIRQAAPAVAAQRGQTVFASLPGSAEGPEEDRLRELLLRAGLAILEELLARKEAQP